MKGDSKWPWDRHPVTDASRHVGLVVVHGLGAQHFGKTGRQVLGELDAVTVRIDDGDPFVVAG